MKVDLLFKAEHAAHHGRPKTLRRAEEHDCDVCGGEERVCLGFDTSDEEYGDFWICEDCSHLAFTDGEAFAREHPLPPESA